ncbi:MAG: hypothetical protein ACRD18_16430 [Terriglobia bacterium]
MANPQDQFFIELAAQLSVKQITFVRRWIEQVTGKPGATPSSPAQKAG